MRLIQTALLFIAILVLQACGPVFRTPPLLLISIDGFQAGYLDRIETPNLDSLASQGVLASGLIPIFPSSTFPNHYSIVTGLYAEDHGIVANTMYDPVFDDSFALSMRDAVADGRWYGGEPIWVTAEKQGKRTATLFWPGSEAEIAGYRPSEWFEYDHDLPHAERVAQILSWFDAPKSERPDFMTLYFHIVDTKGHGGTTTDDLIAAVQKVDSSLGLLVDGLKSRNLYGKVNIIVVSDHGMTDTDTTRLIYLDDYIDLSSVQIINWSPVLGIRPPANLEETIYQQLKNAHPSMQLFLRRDIPERLHYSNHHRIPPIIGLADEGWIITSHEKALQNWEWMVGGAHGYDPRYRSMHGLFIANGPDFKKGFKSGSFQNIHLYNLMAKLLDIDPAPNRGNLDSVSVFLNWRHRF